MGGGCPELALLTAGRTVSSTDLPGEEAAAVPPGGDRTINPLPCSPRCGWQLHCSLEWNASNCKWNYISGIIMFLCFHCHLLVGGHVHSHFTLVLHKFLGFFNQTRATLIIFHVFVYFWMWMLQKRGYFRMLEFVELVMPKADSQLSVGLRLEEQQKHAVCLLMLCWAMCCAAVPVSSWGTVACFPTLGPHRLCLCCSLTAIPWPQVIHYLRQVIYVDVATLELEKRGEETCSAQVSELG